MNRSRPRFWRWPGWSHIGYAALLGSAVSVWFAFVYGGADLLTANRSFRVRLYFDAEMAWPFVPAAVLIYLSIYLLCLSAPFILPTRQELRSLAWTIAAVIAFAGICFLLLPAEVAFPEPSEMGVWTPFVRFAKTVALTHNLAPSLHVGMTVVFIAVYSRRAASVGKSLFWLWAVAMGVSTLLLHQHYVVDVVWGFLLGLAGVRCVYDRGVRGHSEMVYETQPTNRSSCPGQSA
jgi:membrane-associated phospholipid phosphatase